MKNQSMEIPAQLQPEAEILSKELREASEQLHEVQQRYSQAILARTAPQEHLSEKSAPSQTEWDALVQELQEANRRYSQIVSDRVAFTADVNKVIDEQNGR